jgi:hypothetical protein
VNSVEALRSVQLRVSRPALLSGLFVLLTGLWALALNNSRIADNVPQHAAYSILRMPNWTRAIEAAALWSAFVAAHLAPGRARVRGLVVLIWGFTLLGAAAALRAPTPVTIAVYGIFVYVAPLLLYSVARVVVPTRTAVRQLLSLVTVFLIASVGVAFALQFPEVRTKSDSIHGLFSDAHAFGTYLALVSCVAFAWFLRFGGAIYLLLAAAALGLAYFPANEKTLVFTVAWCAAATGVRLLKRPTGGRGLAAACGAALMLAVLLVLPSSVAPSTSVQQLGQMRLSQLGPVYAAGNAGEAVTASPLDLLFGLGPGRFAGVAAVSAVRSDPAVLSSLPAISRRMHEHAAGPLGAAAWAANAWSNLLAEFGVIGVCLFGLALVAVFGPLCAWSPRNGHEYLIRLLVLAMAGLVIWQGLFTPYTSWSEPVLTYPMMLLAAYAARLAAGDVSEGSAG